MTTVWKTLNVFVSSTFLDMELARDKLVHTFRDVEKEILSRQLVIRLYDLRWQDYNKEKSLVKWCMEMVDRCQYFVAILGKRYGWRPPTLMNKQPNVDNISITEMEINRAIRNIDKANRFFCFCNLQEGEISKEDFESLKLLRKKLEDSGEKILVYNDIKEVPHIISEEFKNIVAREYPPGKKVKTLKYSYQEALKNIINEKTAGFVGRIKYLKKIQDFIDSDQIPNYLCIHARAGAGKSALLGNFLKNTNDTKIIAHYMGMGGDSNKIKGVMKHIGQQLARFGLLDEKLAVNPAQASIQIQNAFEGIKKKLAIIIDGIDEIEKAGQKLSWLPRSLPSNIRIILSTRPVEIMHILKEYPHVEFFELPPLNEEEIENIIKNYNSDSDLGLTVNDFDVLKKRAL